MYVNIYQLYTRMRSLGTDGDGNQYIYRAAIEYSGTDYRSFISFHSDELTQIGQKLFQESLESFNYCVLGAEARTRWSIVGKGAKSLQTQDVFRTIVKDTIVQNDTPILISNMRKSIQATNVVLNLAVVPNVILMPSNFIILSDKIEGYNNILTTATNEMEFGVNKDVNYEKPKPKPVNIVNVDSNINSDDWGGGGSYVGNASNDNLRGNSERSKQSERSEPQGKRNKAARRANHVSAELPIMLVVSAVVGIVVSRLR